MKQHSLCGIENIGGKSILNFRRNSVEAEDIYKLYYNSYILLNFKLNERYLESECSTIEIFLVNHIHLHLNFINKFRV